MPRSPRASASPVRVQPLTIRLCAGLVTVAALSVALSACAPESATGESTSTPSVTARPTATASITPRPTATPTTTPTASPTTPPDTRATVDVVIVSWGGGAGSVYASGIVPGLLEEGGTCTLTASSGSEVLTASRDAQRATDSTDCGVLTIAVGAGDWSLVLTYDSADALGVSAPQTATAS